ncbi:sulfotransferase family protein [Dyella sp. A6]|uniref:sulfotransferase family protein n=1 Tax=Dyella aluminiiresistens TaxID=3069105 RepID=UPI002E78BBD8|nr:sulfotransferase [Dyella sp. A6]
MTSCVLVFGMPRSGTTWIGKLFDSHPDTLYRHEPDSMRRLSLPLYPNMDDAPGYQDELERFVAMLPAMRSTEVVGKQPLFPKHYQSAAGLAAYRAGVLAAKAASRMRRHFPTPFRPTASRHAQRCLVWKSIESPGRLGVCMEALPAARGIHLMRHPCGYVASVLRGEAGHQFSGETPMADDRWLFKLLLDTPAAKTYDLHLEDIEALSPEERLAWRWVLIQEKVLADVADCGRVLTVRYEDVCDDPLVMTQRMFQFAGLAWHPQTEAFVRASTQETHSNYYSVFKHPQKSAQRWRSDLPAPVIERILTVLRQSSLARFYPDESQAASVPQEATS